MGKAESNPLNMSHGTCPLSPRFVTENGLLLIIQCKVVELWNLYIFYVLWNVFLSRQLHTTNITILYVLNIIWIIILKIKLGFSIFFSDFLCWYTAFNKISGKVRSKVSCILLLHLWSQEFNCCWCFLNSTQLLL